VTGRQRPDGSLAYSQKAVWRIEHHTAHNIGGCAGRGGLSLLWLWRSLPEVGYALASSGGVFRLARFCGIERLGVCLA
jgi:hypothetical protein